MTQSKRRGVYTRLVAHPVLVLGAALVLCGSLLGQEGSVAFRRAEGLRHGINLSHWFAQVYDAKGYTKEHFDTYDTAKDMALIKAIGRQDARVESSVSLTMANSFAMNSSHCGYDGRERL